MTDYWQVTTATDSREAAETLARSAVEAQLAAGGHVHGPVASMFWHAEKFGTGEEWHAVLKTTSDRYPALEAHLLAAHPWANPEISAVQVVAASQACLEWVRRWTRADGSAQPAG